MTSSILHVKTPIVNETDKKKCNTLFKHDCVTKLNKTLFISNFL